MMKPRVYVETSVISYLTARASKDPIVFAHQQMTQNWWVNAAQHYDLFASQYVLDEASQGNSDAAKARLLALDNLAMLATTALDETIANALLDAKALPMNARFDALHIGVSAANGMDILLTWNYRHLANFEQLKLVENTCLSLGFEPPRILTIPQLTET